MKVEFILELIVYAEFRKLQLLVDFPIWKILDKKINWNTHSFRIKQIACTDIYKWLNRSKHYDTFLVYFFNFSPRQMCRVIMETVYIEPSKVQYSINSYIKKDLRWPYQTSMVVPSSRSSPECNLLRGVPIELWTETH